MSKLMFPVSSLFSVLLITTSILAWSPARKKRGRYGRTISALLVRLSADVLPPFRSRVIADTQTFHCVSDSGTSNSKVTVPSFSNNR